MSLTGDLPWRWFYHPKGLLMSEPVGPPDVSPVPLVVRSCRDPAATRRRWAERLERLQTSALTVAQFCDAEGIS